MKAVLYTEYGSPDNLQFKEVAKPTPKDDEVFRDLSGCSCGAFAGYVCGRENAWVL